ncbi:MAG: hypothetical protein ABGX20_11370 [Bacillus sp. (in: firmicutes)]
MDFVYFNKKSKGLFYAFLVFLVFGVISFNIADSISYRYNMVRDNFVNQINGKDLSNKDIKRLENSLQTINKRFHTSESIAIYVKNDGINSIQYMNSDLKEAEYLFPLNTVKKDNFITEGFQVTEVLESGKYVIVHRYIPDWFFLIPIALFTISGILFMLWILFQIKYAYTTRWTKLKAI